MDEYVARTRYGLLRKLLGIFVVIIPCIIIVGRLLNIPFLYSLLPAGFMPLNPTAALLFIGIGIIADFLLRHQDVRMIRRPQKILLYAFASVLLIASIMVELRSLFGLPVYCDGWPIGTSTGSIMSMNTAICFGFAGIILISLVWVKPIRFGVVRLCAIIILAIAVAAIAGYIVNEPTLYSLGIYSPMSLWSAILFALISGSILRLDYKNAELNKPILISIAIMLTVVVCGMSYMFKSIEQQQQIQQQFTQTDAITTHVNNVLTTALNAEVGVRGYLMTGKSAYLDPYNFAQKQYDSSLNELSAVLDKDNANIFQTFRRLVQDKNDNLGIIIATARSSGGVAGLALMVQGKDEYLIEQIRTVAKQILDETHQETSIIITKQQQVEAQTILNMGVSGGTVFVFLLVVLILLMRETMVRIATEKTLKLEKNAAIEGKAKDDAILTSIGDGVFALDSNNVIVLFNKAAETISGFSAAHAIGRRYDDVLHFTSEDGVTRRDNFIATAQSGRQAKMANHTVLRTRSGNLVSVADSAAPIMNANGDQFGVIVVFRDVTKQRQLETAKDEFISLASHQLRTPLTSMRLFLEMLLKNQLGEFNKGQRRYLTMIEISTLRMIRLVGDMLNVSRIELGRLRVYPVPTDINKLIMSHCDDMRPLLKEKRLHLSFKPDKHLPFVSVDPILYDQIIHNLLANAIRYTPDGGKIIVDCRSTKNGIRLTVKDTGIGIPVSAKLHIFERFFRAENAIHMVGEGTGLGLYLVKLILDSSGGSISFTSHEGKGTTFTVRIPPGGMKARNGDKTLA